MRHAPTSSPSIVCCALGLTAAVLSLVFAVAAVAQSAGVRAIESIRFGVREDGVRVVIGLDAAPIYRLSVLPEPPRLVVDLAVLPETSVRIAPALDQGALSFKEGRPIVLNRNMGLFTPSVFRLVFTLDSSYEVLRYAVLDKPSRLYVDLAPAASMVLRFPLYESESWSESQRAEGARQRRVTARVDRPSALPLVMIDAGHGGIDPGAIQKIKARRILEKNIVLRFALALEADLKKSGRYRAELTRRRDIFVPLRERFDLAERHNADIFLSLHADSFPNPRYHKSVRGMTLYTLSEDGLDAEAEALARQENRSDVIAGHDLAGYNDQISSVLISIAQRETRSLSERVARILVESARADGLHLSRKPKRSAGFVVLKSPTIPSVLVELGYMSNQQDLRNLQSSDYRNAVVVGIVRALDAYFAAVSREAVDGAS